VNWQPLPGAEMIVAGASSEEFVVPDSALRCFYVVVDLAPPAP